MAWTVAQAQASQAVHKHTLSVNNIHDYHIDEYPNPVCTKHACLAQLLKYAQQKVVPALLCCLILIASPPCMLVLSASAMMPAWSIRAETSFVLTWCAQAFHNCTHVIHSKPKLTGM